ncbi:uncharacterized protein LOC101944500 isoform X8 [Chrysemys picta bellii]|uniref:uncharacterized protein LOC101944500 isoform X8 n=1 Tax=Chrysemys picta bellii TaxID=8478 RepID=UPI0032B184D9
MISIREQEEEPWIPNLQSCDEKEMLSGTCAGFPIIKPEMISRMEQKEELLISSLQGYEETAIPNGTGDILWLSDIHDVTETLSLADNSETIENDGDLEGG